MLKRLLTFRAAKREALAQARAAELRGELAQAAVLFAQALRPDEAARVMVLRGDAEVDPGARLRHYVQAVATAPPGSQAAKHAARKRASTVIDVAADVPMTATLRQELAAAARELEELGDPERAAQGYARAGDLDGEVRALARSGDVDRVDALLAAAEQRDREARARARAREEVEMLVASGRRREAVALARASADPGVQDRGVALARAGVTGGVLRVVVGGREMLLALGESVVIGRAPRREEDDLRTRAREACIAIASAALSRRHVVVERRGDDFVVRDLGSRNGTSLRGLRLEGEAHVGEGLDLSLAGEVPVSLHPLREPHDFAGALAVDVPAGRYVAPLGLARLPVGSHGRRWRLERGDDGWAELVTGDAPPAFAGALQLAPRVTLLVGDAIAAARSGPPVLEVRADAF